MTKFDEKPARLSCICGCGSAEMFACERTTTLPVDLEVRIDRAIEASIFRAVFPSATTRRNLIASLGSSTLLAALAEALPIGIAQALAQSSVGPIEKTKLSVGFVPITCTVPLLLADAMGEFRKEGLEVSLQRTPSWALVRDKLISGEFDASHLVLGMPFTMTLGIGSSPVMTHVATVQNTNGSAITLAMKHRENRDPKNWKGFKFGIPHDHSIHAMLLRYYLAEHGLDPDRDVELRVYPPPDSVANMAAGNLDGLFFAEPWGQRAVFEGVGFIHLLSKDIFPDHPCCTLSVGNRFLSDSPNSFGAFIRAVVRATAFADKHENRQHVAELLAPANYLNQPRRVLEQVLLGHYADGLGKVVDAPGRIGFDPFPYESTAIWVLTQLRRWKIIPTDVDYKLVAERVLLSTGAAKAMADVGLPPPGSGMAKLSIMGREFDPTKPANYLQQFPIKRA
ncbi:CmpA/NrtA family ABC transporter substrate-binding protein [Beijerinckia sp. L45]|uniref:CmpA/NrtA family ABC transporter substrate-binding protein n=1 Tax=Beijerinckia sp. L45 TaxID=1641855 RepID=UPI00131EACE8|nr:CmpA/NrtA family ABC transporter substrate-binding protein [Beijerinckia sp. L45]